MSFVVAGYSLTGLGGGNRRHFGVFSSWNNRLTVDYSLGSLCCGHIHVVTAIVAGEKGRPIARYHLIETVLGLLDRFLVRDEFDKVLELKVLLESGKNATDLEDDQSLVP